jgi:alginate O-acetyltransferase complex protein AlgI
MIFNSLQFAVFLPIALLLYHASRRWRGLQNLVLVAAGYVFYGCWDPRFLFLVSVSTVLDYCTGLMIGVGRMTLRQRLEASGYLIGAATLFVVLDLRAVDLEGSSLVRIDPVELTAHAGFGLRLLGLSILAVLIAHALYPRLAALPEEQRRRFFLRCSLIGQLGMLGVFKYFDFFVASANLLANRLGLDVSRLHLNLILPVGISFYTLQTLSYVCDVYWRRQQPVTRLLDFALFVSYFPPLVAGPIERASHLIPRLMGDRKVTQQMVWRGVWLVLIGLFKKMAIADALADSVGSVFEGGAPVGALDVVAGAVAFALQIYGDFSGYSDIASGVSLFFGIDLLKNFDQPYFSMNPSEFWRRWHISLSTWLRDYLYIPLGGNRHGEIKTYRNLMLTMLLGGLWHGAAWNYLFWGLYQGLLLVAHRLVTRGRPEAPPATLWGRLPRMLLFFSFVCYGWLLFRCTSLDQLLQFTRLLVSGPWTLSLHMKAPPPTAVAGLPLLLLLEVLQYRSGLAVQDRRLPAFAQGALAAALLLLVLAGASNETREFIYFRF